MSSKTKTSASPGTNLQALKIGSRVRCTDDGVEGRIVWANAVSVKIRWDDGEQVTWRRDSLATRPIEILAAGGGEEQAVAPIPCEQSASLGLPQTEEEAAPTIVQEFPSPELPVAEPASETVATARAEQPVEVPTAEPTEVPEADALEQARAEDTQTELAPPTAADRETPTPPEHGAGQPEAIPAAAKKPRTRKPKDTGDGKEKRLSALDAAAKVLAEAGQPMTCQEMITAMAEKGYWVSPKGRTPAATIYSAVLREIQTKAASSRFKKTERGKFAFRGDV
jgi:hypothetical protein